jgi:hypothetical protein
VNINMVRGVILFAVLLTLASLFVSASMVEKGSGHEVEIELKEGWNIVAGTFIDDDSISPDSDIKEEDVLAMWYYSPLQKKYFLIHPIEDETWREIEKDDDDFVFTNAMWIYSERDGTIKYNTLEDYPPLNQRKLLTGWNFVTITSDMTFDSSIMEFEERSDYTLRNFKGSCNFEAVYHFEQITQEWSSNLVNDDFMNEEMDSHIAGLGMLVKVSDDCNLGSLSRMSPPVIPVVEKMSDCDKVKKDVSVSYKGYTCVDSSSGEIKVQMTRGSSEEFLVEGLMLRKVSGAYVSSDKEFGSLDENSERVFSFEDSEYKDASSATVNIVLSGNKVCEDEYEVTLSEC